MNAQMNAKKKTVQMQIILNGDMEQILKIIDY